MSRRLRNYERHLIQLTYHSVRSTALMTVRTTIMYFRDVTPCRREDGNGLWLSEALVTWMFVTKSYFSHVHTTSHFVLVYHITATVV